MESSLQKTIENGDSQAMRSILLTEENYRIIFDNSALAITVTDANENIVVWNKCAETLLGWGPDELFSKPVAELYPPEEWSKIRAASIRQKGINRQIETKIITKNRRIIEVDLSIGFSDGRTESCMVLSGLFKIYLKGKRLKETSRKVWNFPGV